MKRYLFILSTLVLATACSHDDAPPPASAAPVNVRVEAIRAASLPGVIEAGGTVRARTVAVVSSRIVSPILRVHVKTGDRVRRGQPLVTLDARQLDAAAGTARATLAAATQGSSAAQAEVASAEAALTLARTSHDRIARLRERNSATQGELDDAVAGLRGAEARLLGARARLTESERAIDAARGGLDGAAVSASYAVLAAPFDGVVTDKPADPGTMAAPGMPLVTIEDARRFRLEVSVDATSAPSAAPGAHVPVTIEGIGTLDGVIAEAASSVDPGSHAFVVKIDLPDDDRLRTGLFGRARFTGAPAHGLSVPESSVVRRGQLALVFVEEKGVARLRAVHPGEARAGRVPILAGVVEGDRVILEPPPGLADGATVSAAGGRMP
jgi:RND family efflux transporter MFP subunit